MDYCVTVTFVIKVVWYVLYRSCWKTFNYYQTNTSGMHWRLLLRKWYKPLHTKLLFLGKTGEWNLDHNWCAGHIFYECFISSICSFKRDILSSIQENVSWLQGRTNYIRTLVFFSSWCDTYISHPQCTPILSHRSILSIHVILFPWIEYIKTRMADFIMYTTF